MTDAALDSQSPVEHPPGSKPRRNRRWWFYLGISLGVLALLGIVAVAGIVMYWRSLIQDYTTTEPQPLPVVQQSDVDFTAFYTRWTTFYEAVGEGTAAQNFQATAGDLNRLIARNADLKDRVRVIITNNQVFGQFTFPLDKAKQRELHGRHINGLVRLNLNFEDGWLTVGVAELHANGKPIPRWILKKVQRENLAKDLDKNPEATAFLHQLEAIAVEDDQIVLKPHARR
jgi:hypothetical protein